MKHILKTILALSLVACNSTKENRLNDKIQTLELTYITWACDCAKWSTKEDLVQYAKNDGDSLASRSIYIEPAKPSLTLPDTLGYGNDLIKFTGQFYKYKAYPKGYTSQQNPDKARVFRYTGYQVIKSNHHKSQKAINEEQND